MRYQSKPPAFTLVELIVAITITSILLLGVSVFFTQNLTQLNQIENQQGASREHFVFQEVLRKKLMQGKQVIHLTEQNAIVQNASNSQTPFTFIGLEEGHIVLTDSFLFHDIELEKTGDDFPTVPSSTGITYADSHYYVASFTEEAIYECKANGNCTLFLENIPSPVGLSSDGKNLFVSDAIKGDVWQIELGETNQRTKLISGLKQPTGLAYYLTGEEGYLFMAESQSHLIKRFNLQTRKTDVVVGLNDDPTCNSSASYCKLNFPTGLLIHKGALYIADSGHGRILKMSEPEVMVDQATDVVLEFDIDPSIQLQKFTLSGNIGGETSFDPKNSNFSGNDLSYDAQAKEFNNYVFETNPVDGCQLSEGVITSQDLENHGFEVGDYVGFDGDLYKITNFKGQKDCQTDPEGDPIYRYVTVTDPPPKGKENIYGYGANYAVNDLGEIDLALTDLKLTQEGFQTIEIETYDLNDSLMETDEIMLRVGNGILGSKEDAIEVWVDGLNYPTGLSIEEEDTLWVTDTYQNSLSTFELDSKQFISETPLQALKVDDFSPFDLRSKFSVMDFSLNEVQENLLEVSFEAQLNENLSQTYSLNKAIVVE